MQGLKKKSRRGGAPEMKNWNPPAFWRRITTIDLHTEGEPFRVVTSGVDPIPGKTILEKRRFAIEHLDGLRRTLLWEPRGHADMYGCFVTEPVTPDGDFGVLFLHNEGFSTMCGHGIIGIATAAAETGFVKPASPEHTLRIDSPAGRVTATVEWTGGRARSVTFDNVPSFAPDLDCFVEVPGIGKVRYDLGFGGAFYAFVNAGDLGLACTPGHVSDLIRQGMAIKRAVMASRTIDHPFEPDLGFLYGTIFTQPSEEPGVHSSHVCVFAEGEVDRSPTGTGVSARLAILRRRGDVEPGQEIVIRSIIKTGFSCRVVRDTRFGPFSAVIPRVSGTAHITGRHEFLVDPEDPLHQGFVLR
jgi:trans-L-3-hydroxyproline dehydratase